MENQIKYDRNKYKYPEFLWTDVVTEDELLQNHKNYQHETDTEIDFRIWLETEQFFEQVFAEELI